MHLIYSALENSSGSTEGDVLVGAMKGMTWESPRGRMSIDPDTRDVIHNVYIRRVERIGGELYNGSSSPLKRSRIPSKPRGKRQTETESSAETAFEIAPDRGIADRAVHSLRNTSDVQLSAFGVPPAGYMSSTSMLAYFFMRSMREQGAWIWLPIVAGTAIHLPFNLAEILHHAVNFAVLPDDRRLAVLIPRLQNEKCDHPIPAYDEKGVFTAEAWNVLG